MPRFQLLLAQKLERQDSRSLYETQNEKDAEHEKETTADSGEISSEIHGDGELRKRRSFRTDMYWAAMKDNLEYAAIIEKANDIEDVAPDCWGALFFSLVHDFPQVMGGRADLETIVRFGFSLLLSSINFFIQLMLLYFITRLLVLPDIALIQETYTFFGDNYYDSSGANDSDMFDALSFDDKARVCGIALSEGIFMRIILFLWLSQNMQELKDITVKMTASCSLPRLPQGVDPILMIRDMEETESKEAYVVCLRLKDKALLMIFIFIPKYIIASSLAVAGCVWLMSASTMGDLILNSLALAFVVQIDELLAQTFFPAFYFEVLEKLALQSPAPVMTAEEESRDRAFDFIKNTVVVVGVVLMCEFAYVLQPVIPDYQSDVQNACKEFVRSQVPKCLPGMLSYHMSFLAQKEVSQC